jgi:S1-C subfamily serine protease
MAVAGPRSPVLSTFSGQKLPATWPVARHPHQHINASARQHSRSGTSTQGLWQSTLHHCADAISCETPAGRIDLPVDFHATGARLGIPEATRRAIQEVGPATVMVRAYKDDKSWLGSGVILKPADIDPAIAGALAPDSYLILTNHHVAGDAGSLTVTIADGSPTGREVMASVLRSPKRGYSKVADEISDAALLVIHSKTPLPTARLASAAQLADLQLGDHVVTAGYPAGLPRLSVTKGVVSQPRQYTMVKPYPVIQIDAPINGGNSGGPLVRLPQSPDDPTLVIGLNTFGLRGRESMNFGIPVTEQLTALRAIFRTGRMTRGTLGVEWKSLGLHKKRTLGLPEHLRGAVVSGVSNSLLQRVLLAPLGLALMNGDIVTQLTPRSGRPLDLDIKSKHDTMLIADYIHDLTPGEWIRASIVRKVTEDGREFWKRMEVRLRVNDAYRPKASDAQAEDAPVAQLFEGLQTYLA